MVSRYALAVMCALCSVVTAYNFGISRWDIQKIIDGGVNSGWNEYAWGVAVDGDTMIIGSNRYHENNSAIGMVLVGTMSPEMVFLAGIEGSPYPVGTPQWGIDNSARIFKCTGLLSSGPSVTCTQVKQAGNGMPVCRPAGSPCPEMRPLPATMCFPESYGYRAIRRISGQWIALGMGSVLLGMPTKVWTSTTGDAGTWIDISANLDVLNPANCPTGVYVQPREFTEFNGEVCITTSRMVADSTNAGFTYYTPALMCKPTVSIADPTVRWVNRIDGAALQIEGNRDIFYLEKFPEFKGKKEALFASVNNYGYNNDISLGGYQIWYTYGVLDANNHYIWTQLITNGFGDAAAQMGMTLKYWNGNMYVGSATWMGLILNPDSSIYGVGKGFELVRVDSRGRAELVVGDPIPRIAPNVDHPHARDFPVSNLPAGFGWPFNAYAWQIESYNGWLYLGTYDAFSKFYKFGRNAVHYMEAHPEALEAMTAGIDGIDQLLGMVDSAIDLATLFGIDVAAVHTALDQMADDLIFNTIAGYDLWKSPDGLAWYPVELGGMGNGAQVGVRRLVAANDMLYIGTASFYGDGFEISQAKVIDF